MDKQKILLVPGTIQYLKNYGGYDGLDIWMEKGLEIPAGIECFIGHSLGVNFILKESIDPGKKFIFINPLIKKRNLLDLFVRWMRFHFFEGLSKEKEVPERFWPHTVDRAWHLLKVDVLGQMKKIPRENVFIIRGRQDDFYCDHEDLKILKENNFKVIEVEAGHDWNESVANEVAKAIGVI